MMFRLPGFGGSSPSPPPIAPAVTREDPAVSDAKRKLRLSELQRAGRAQTSLAPDEDKLGTPNVDRPTAMSGTVRSATNLG